MSAPLTEPSLLGSLLVGRYEVRAQVGRGGMGEVFEAVDRRLGRTVAIKVLRAELAADERFLARFRTEAATAARLTHAGIVSVFDIGEDAGRTFIVMEFVPGRTLAQIARDDGPLCSSQIARMGAAAARALGHAHDRGVVHRDVSPGNVMVTRDGSVKVLDFGIARGGSAALRSTAASRGTLPYLAPELLRGERSDGRADVYALGAVLAELARDDEQPDLTRALARATAPDPRDRFITAAAFADALDGVAGPPGVDSVTTLELMRPARAHTAPIVRTATRPLGSAGPSSSPRTTTSAPDPRSSGPAGRRSAPTRGIVVAGTRQRRRRPGRVLVSLALAGVTIGGAIVVGQVFLSASAPQAVATVTGPEAVPAPTGLTATSSCDGLFSTGVDLEWSGSGPAKGYEIWRGSGGGDRELVARVRGVHHETFRDVDLGVDARYTYRVRAFDGPRVSTWSSVADVDTPFLCLT